MNYLNNVSHNIIKYKQNYEVLLYDCVWDRCKNLHKINTIEIFFTITPEDLFAIEYQFHEIDFEIWITIQNFHKTNVKNVILYDYQNAIVDENNIKCFPYNFFKLKSSDFNLYRNINYIPCLHMDKWNNVNESMALNTISGKPLLK